MRKHIFFICSLLLLCPVWARAQVQWTGDGNQSPEDRSSLRFWTANDVFYLPWRTDQYYTSGFGFEYHRYHKRQIGGQQVAENRYWRLTEDIFTPNQVQTDELLTNDRPFASYLILERGQSRKFTNGLSIDHRFTGGVLGKYSGGGRLQNAFHRMIDFAQELEGWAFEVKPDLILNYRGEVAKDWVAKPAIELSTFGSARLGSLHTDATVGARAGFTLGKQPRRSFKVTATADLRAVAYNATLSGGLFNRDDRYRGVISPQRIVASTAISSTLRVEAISLHLDMVMVSPEFRGGFGHIYAILGASYSW